MRISALAVVLSLLLAGCGGGSAAPSSELTVLAAASLSETFTELGEQYERANPGVTVRFNFAASSDLASQIVNGAPADVFAAASESTMRTVTDAGRAVGAPTVFASNVLTIATAPGNPKGIASFADLARPDLQVVVCAPQVPCGAAAEKIEQSTGVVLSPVSEEPDVRSTLGKVTTGNADAALVYVTDVAAAGASVQGVPFPESAQARTDYPIAVIADDPQARAFVDLVTGAAGRAVLRAAGFGTP